MLTGFSNPCQLQSVKVRPVLLLGSFGNDDGNRGSENIRDFKIQRRGRQRERQKNNRFKKQNNNFARASHLFCTFLSRLCTTATWKCLISRFLKDVMKQRRNYIPLFELGYGHLKFSFRRVRLYLTKHVGRNSRYEDWKNANSFSLLSCRWMLKFLTSPFKGLCRFFFFFQTFFWLFLRALNIQM